MAHDTHDTHDMNAQPLDRDAAIALVTVTLTELQNNCDILYARRLVLVLNSFGSDAMLAKLTKDAEQPLVFTASHLLD